MNICDKCIRAIKSRGETILVGDVISDWGADMECEWCNEMYEELNEVKFE